MGKKDKDIFENVENLEEVDPLESSLENHSEVILEPIKKAEPVIPPVIKPKNNPDNIRKIRTNKPKFY